MEDQNIQVSELTKSIYVAYIGVGIDDIDHKEIDRILKSAYDAMYGVLSSDNAETIFIPVRSNETRIECINPKYITEEFLLKKHTLLIDELHKRLDAHINELINKEK